MITSFKLTLTCDEPHPGKSISESFQPGVVGAVGVFGLLPQDAIGGSLHPGVGLVSSPHTVLPVLSWEGSTQLPFRLMIHYNFKSL